MNNTYIIRGGGSGADRLKILAEAMWPGTERILQKIGIRDGMHCLDFGCGGGDVSVKLAELVGRCGSVTGLDMDHDVLERARALALDRGVKINFVQQRCEVFDAEEQYDLGYARFLLSHLADPLDGLKRLVTSVRPGGWIFAEDVHIASHFFYPDSPSIARYIEIYARTGIARGAHPNMGRELVSLFMKASVADVKIGVSMPTFRTGPGKTVARVTLENIADAAIELGITTKCEVEELTADLTSYERDPTTVLSIAQTVQVWGMRPPGAL